MADKDDYAALVAMHDKNTSTDRSARYTMLADALKRTPGRPINPVLTQPPRFVNQVSRSKS